MAPPMPRGFSSSCSPSSASDHDIADAVNAILAEAADLCALQQLAKLNTVHLSGSSCSSNRTGDVDVAAAVDAILAEAADLCALEQVAKLNTAHLSDSSLLPSDLEARFRRLKSFPATNARSKASEGKENVPSLDRSATAPIAPVGAKNSGDSLAKNDADVAEDSPPANQEATKKLKPKSKYDLGSPPSFPLPHPPSPPRQGCCFLLSPKKGVRSRKGRGDDALPELGIARWLKEERRKLKKALREQEKANKEAEKMVQMMKQASARMDVESIDEEWPSDDDEEHK